MTKGELKKLIKEAISEELHSKYEKVTQSILTIFKRMNYKSSEDNFIKIISSEFNKYGLDFNSVDNYAFWFLGTDHAGRPHNLDVMNGDVAIFSYLLSNNIDKIKQSLKKH